MDTVRQSLMANEAGLIEALKIKQQLIERGVSADSPQRRTVDATIKNHQHNIAVINDLLAVRGQKVAGMARQKAAL